MIRIAATIAAFAFILSFLVSCSSRTDRFYGDLARGLGQQVERAK
jgi:hypothetical protein